MTFCELVTYICTCGKSMEVKEVVEDEYILKYKQLHEEESSIRKDLENP